MKKILLYGLLLGFPFSGYTQYNGLYPLGLLRYTDQHVLDNPASNVRNPSTSLQFLHSSFTSIGGNVGLSYLNTQVSIPSSNSKNGHLPGILIHSEYDTDILKRTRVYAKYNWYTTLSKKTKLAAGIHAGFFNYSVKSSNSSAGISQFVPDATLGLWLNNPRYNVGVSSSQILESALRPFRNTYTLDRYYCFNADISVISNYSTSLLFATRYAYLPKQQNMLTLYTTLIVARHLTAEVNYTISKGTSVSIGFIELSFLKNKAAMYFSYFHTANSTKATLADRFEVSLNYYFTKKKTEEDPQEED